MRRSRPTSIRWARRRHCYPTKAEEGPFASHVLGCKVPWNREVLQGRRWRHHPPRGQGLTPRGVDKSRRTVAWQANAPPLAKASACAFRIVDSLPCLRERAPDSYRLAWAGAALVGAVGMFYRYLKFFKHYTTEVFNSYAELKQEKPKEE